mgnify:CR=1 FL=1
MSLSDLPREIVHSINLALGKCGSRLACGAPSRIYRGTAPELNYPVTVNLCDAHLESSRADGWVLVLQELELPETD